MGDLVKVAETTDVPTGECTTVDAAGHKVALALSEPAPSGVSCYQVHVEGNEIKIEIP